MSGTLREGEGYSDLVRVMQAEVANARVALDRTGESPQFAVHEARKAIKRVRALARLVRTADRDMARRIDAAARRAGDVLAEARDADSLEGIVARLLEDDAGPGTRSALEEIAAPARQDRERIDLAAAVAQAQSALDAVDRLLAAIRPADGPGIAMAKGLARTWRRAAKRLDAARDKPDGKRLHALRRRVQDWRYQVDALEPVWPDGVYARRAEAERLSDLLGEHHDLTRLAERLDRLAEAGAALDEVDRRRDRLEKEALDLAGEIFGRKPKGLKKALEAGF